MQGSTVMEEVSRREVLCAHGAGEEQLGELLACTARRFEVPAEVWRESEPLPDEPSTACWEEYAAAAAAEGVFECLRERLVQLRFPIAEGISRDPIYRAATRRGEFPPGGPMDGGLRLQAPERLELFIHSTPAGRLPVLVCDERADFEALLQALTRRNEPLPVPPALGAMMIAGYNNWHRIHTLKRKWESEHPGGDWGAAFRALVPRKELYQDRLIVLSRGPYSAVPAESLGLEPEAWLELSATIRLEHECSHYFTRRALGTMENAVHDEVIADYAGIVAAAGRYRADWFLRFMGLEGADGCRPDGRLQSYRGDPPLSDASFLVLGRLVRSLAANLEVADAQRPSRHSLADRRRAICALASLSLEEMASDGGDRLIAAAFACDDGPPQRQAAPAPEPRERA